MFLCRVSHAACSCDTPRYNNTINAMFTTPLSTNLYSRISRVHKSSNFLNGGFVISLLGDYCTIHWRHSKLLSTYLISIFVISVCEIKEKTQSQANESPHIIPGSNVPHNTCHVAFMNRAGQPLHKKVKKYPRAGGGKDLRLQWDIGILYLWTKEQKKHNWQT